MSKEVIEIHGNAIPTPVKIPDWNQTDETKSDYIKNKPIVFESGFGIPFDVTGTNLVTIENVNPKEHDVKVQLSSKNILFEHKYKQSETIGGITCDYEGNGIFHIYGEETLSSLTSYSLGEVTYIAIPIKSDSYYTFYAKVIEGSSTVRIHPFINTSVSSYTTSNNWISIDVNPNTAVGTILHNTKKGNAVTPNATYANKFRFFMTANAGTAIMADIRIQVWLVEGKYDETSQYTPYFDSFDGVEIRVSENESHEYTSYLPDGEGKTIVKSVSPTMHITTDADGVQINAKGYLDGLSVIDELKQAIISLGGNI